MDKLLHLPVNAWSVRPNHLSGEGGALNAGYTPVDALARISNLLGQHGLQYGVDFEWERFEYHCTPESDKMDSCVALTFNNDHAMLTAKVALQGTPYV